MKGNLYGRGTAPDLKAGVAGMVCTGTKLKDKDLGLKIQLQILSDKEDWQVLD